MLHIEQIRPELTWRLRRDALYPGKDIFEMEMDEDSEGVHFGAFKENKIVGVVSLFQKGNDFQFRKLAVDLSQQKTGIGSSMLEYISGYAAENGGTRLWCNARITATDFYLRSGFAQTGRFFVKGGIDYEIMEKAITPAPDR
jgi:GNAT superfamily N-acetyltransferase